MAHLATGSVVSQLEALFDGSLLAGNTDRELLERCSARRDAGAEAAFAVLVARHGPTVMRVCREILGDRQLAEDAFQAVFFVLACKARSIRNPDLLGSWLYGVALRTAHREKILLRRLRKHEAAIAARGSSGALVGAPMALSTDNLAMAREHAEILHDEVARLPNRFRLPVILCYFEGLALDEAARRLRWPAGTFRSRLARARDKLRRRLVRRGVVLPSTALVLAVSPRSTSALLPSHLCEITARAALGFATGKPACEAVSAAAAAVAGEVLRSMLRQNLRAAAITLLLLGAVVTTAGVLARGLAIHDEPKSSPPLTQLPVAANRKPTTGKPAPGRMFVVGRVLDPQGKPVPNAMVMVHAGAKLPGRVLGPEGMGPEPIGHASSDASGRFQIDALRTSSSRHHHVGAVAIAPGYGAGWVEFDADLEQPGADITVLPEHVIHGRLFDLQGRPVRDVTINVRALLHRVRRSPGQRDEWEGPFFWQTQPEDLKAWPQSAITDAEGRFTLRGVGRGTQVFIDVDDPRFARQRIEIDTDTVADSKPLRMVLQPAQIITGRVTYADNGKPVPHAWLHVWGRSEDRGASRAADFQADAEGWFRANAEPRDRCFVVAHSPDRQPYLSIRKSFDWPKGAIRHSVDLALPRGIPIRGNVTDAASGQPIAGAAVRYRAHSKPGANPDTWSSPAETAADGSFEFAVVPQPGYLRIRAPSEDYITHEIDDRLLSEGQPGGRRVYGHAFIPCDPKPGNTGLEFNIVLRRGVVQKGRVIGPDGQPVRDAWIFSRLVLGLDASAARTWFAGDHGHARDGRFELHGLDPAAEYPVYFLEPNQKLGATIHLSGKSAGGPPVTVRLEPCGAARARLVDAGGKPIAMRLPPRFITMVVTPGPPFSAAQSSSGQLFADEGALSAVDPVNHPNALLSDADGRVEISVLIPGAPYRIVDRTTLRDPSGPQLRKEFRVRPGETLELGEIRIENPQILRVR